MPESMSDPTNWAALKFGLDFIATVGLFTYFLYSTFIKKKDQANANSIKVLSKKHDDLDRQVQELKSNQALLATHEDISKIRSELSGLGQKVEAMKHTLDLIQDHLINKGIKR